ncbi:DedA family protein [Thiotrichales bacterium 19S9-12]|nr:DedA family protein [Thiotrichales bacterium 19S9-11]MCF6811709.1 DedA family protein [Thiotrichales bacterium 19S9-12]
MEWISTVIDFVLHLNVHLVEMVEYFGLWVYAILFTVVFLETGIVLAPFLPGDSLLFAAGSISSFTEINVHLLVMLLISAAFFGDMCNYWIGHYFGAFLVRKKIVKQKYIDKTHEFFERHGGKTIIIARFVPIIRTFAPFVAGMSDMSYRRFMSFNIVGAVLWVALVTYAGYFFGNMPIIKDNFTIVIFVIILLSISPAIFEFIRHRYLVKGKKS